MHFKDKFVLGLQESRILFYVLLSHFTKGLPLALPSKSLEWNLSLGSYRFSLLSLYFRAG